FTILSQTTRGAIPDPRLGTPPSRRPGRHGAGTLLVADSGAAPPIPGPDQSGSGSQARDRRTGGGPDHGRRLAEGRVGTYHRNRARRGRSAGAPRMSSRPRGSSLRSRAPRPGRSSMQLAGAEAQPGRRTSWPARSVRGPVATAAALLAVLGLLGGWVWRAPGPAP